MSISKVGFLLLFIVMPYELCFCQIISQKSVDSLLVAVKDAPADTFKLNALHRLGDYYFQRRFKENIADQDTALLYFKKELELSNQLHEDKGSGRLESLCSIGDVYLSKNQFNLGKSYFIQVCDYYKKTGNKRLEGKTWLRLGECTLRTAAVSGQLPQIIKIYEDAASLFIACGDVEDELLAYWGMASIHFRYAQPDQAEAAGMRAITKYGNTSRPELIKIYFVLGHVQRYRGNLNKALRYALEALKRLEESTGIKDKTATRSALYGELALIYDELGQTENSIIWYKKTLAIRENMHIKLEFIYRTVGFIVQALIKQRKYNEAFDIAQRIEKRHPADNDRDRAMITLVMAYCYDALGNNAKAEELYLLTLKLFGDIKTDEIVSLAKFDVARFYIKLKKYQKAASVLDEDVNPGMPVTRLRDYHLIYYQIDSANEKFASALQHHILYKMYNDSIFNIEKNKKLQELQVQFETEQKEHDIKSLKIDGVLQREKTVQANNIRNLTLAGSALLIILLALFYTNYRAKQRSNIALNTLVREKDNLLKEKEWLIKEIHHRVKNNLQIVMGLLQRQSAYIDNEAALKAIQNSENRMHAVALIHQKLYQSESLDLINMPEYVSELISFLAESTDTGSRLSFEKAIDDVYLTVSQAVPLGLIMNEAITNAIKYAYRPDEYGVIRVALKRLHREEVMLTIEDKGRGLPYDFDRDRTNSLGMSLIKGLSKQINGAFDANNDNGVQIKITFKIEPVNRQSLDLTNA